MCGPGICVAVIVIVVRFRRFAPDVTILSGGGYSVTTLPWRVVITLSGVLLGA